MTNPITALLIFLVICILTYLIYYPKKGWYWKIRERFKTDNKTLIEDILKKLYHAENTETNLQINDITDSLNKAPKKIVEVITNMESSGLISSIKGSLKLEKTGREYALKIIRVHRLWEQYLSEKTGFNKKDWHEIAEKMEHKLNHIETNELAISLGNPRFDPHGDPIPTETGEITKINGKALSAYPANTIGRIVHIEDEPKIIYQQILAEDLHIGSIIRIIETNKKRIVFYSEGEEYILAPIVAGNITINPLKKEAYSTENTSRLSSLKLGEKAKIIGISRECRGDIRRRLLDLGFVINTEIHIDMESPMRNPRAYLIRNTSIAIRNEQAKFILIEKL
ncbi:MAG: metal-dependent transcriptional regulator [Lutibacter sp.]|nr:metal-dependent transcriptional regulator [Lutibacter sp.]